MAKKHLLLSACAIALAIVSAPVYGQDEIRYHAEEQIAEQSAVQPASFRLFEPRDGKGGKNGKGKSCCDEACWDWWNCPDGGIVATMEVVWLRPHASDPGTNSGYGNHYSDGSRFTIGYLNDSGEEVRIRIFEWDTDADPALDAIDIRVFDTEYAGRFNLGCHWAGEVSLGARYAEFLEDGENEFVKSLGPVIGVHLKSNSIVRNANLFGTARYSHQFAEEENGDVASFTVTELQIGMEASRETRMGRVELRSFFEAQSWTGDVDGSDEDLGLFGLGFAAQITR